MAFLGNDKSSLFGRHYFPWLKALCGKLLSKKFCVYLTDDWNFEWSQEAEFLSTLKLFRGVQASREVLKGFNLELEERCT